jgi:tetratricopeptide (TPR) repeat protein
MHLLDPARSVAGSRFAGSILGLLSAAALACGSGEPARPVDLQSPAHAADPAVAAEYVGVRSCAACHAEQARLWRGSDHDRAMQEPGAATVVGRFDGVTRLLGGTPWTPSASSGRYFVRVDGGEELEIARTFGHHPLQQYLVRGERGRLQVLPIAWDARPAEAGGERWIHLYEDDPPQPGSRLHWTGAEQTWNYQCAECHSTALVRGYRVEDDSYDTHSPEPNVACEACHGPGSRHVAWAEADESARDDYKASGLVADIRRSPGRWRFDDAQPIARRSSPATHAAAEIQVCAPCHARRSPLGDGAVPGAAFLDGYRPALLDDPLYFADGQIRDEVYVWGSFVQSRMYAAGVRCSDCHDPHTLEVRGGADGVCSTCHQTEVFGAREHHGHEPGSSGSSCVECHMPERTYMRVDARRDHSIRVPRPDLAAALGTPDACTGCHAHENREPAWAAGVLAERGDGRNRTAHYGSALRAARSGAVDAEARIVALLADVEQPAIARATGASLLGPYLSASSIETLRSALHDPSPLVRFGALIAAESIDPRSRISVVRGLLTDPLRAVRSEAARILAPTPPDAWQVRDRIALADALAEYRNAQHAVAERPEAWLNLGVLHAQLGELDEAERAYRRALALAPAEPAPHANLADLLRLRERETEAEALLRAGLERAPQSAELHYALALSRVRSGARDEALALLRKATQLRPSDVTYAYAHALSLHDAKRTGEAIEELERAHRERPAARNVLLTLATLERDRGQPAAALAWVQRLLEIDPGSSGAHALASQLSTQTKTH